MRTTIVCLLLFMQNVTSYGQELFPGSEFPDTDLQVQIGDSTRIVRILKESEKLYILDFWNIWCSGCIKAMPKLDSLSRLFKDKIEIILITKNTTEETKKIFNRPALSNLSMGKIHADSVMSKYFPHKSVPLNVWIYRGKVLFVTHAYNTTAMNIASVLQGIPISLSYFDSDFDLDEDKPLWLSNDKSIISQVNIYSYVSPAIEKSGAGGFRRYTDSITNTVGVRFINLDKLRLFQYAYQDVDPDFQFISRIRIETTGMHLYEAKEHKSIDDWRRQNVVCYELRIPKSKSDQLLTYMKQDLSKYFDFDAKVEKREVYCWVIESINQYVDQDKNSLIPGRRNKLMSLVWRLNNQYRSNGTIIIDESNTFVSEEIGGDFENLELLNRELSKHNLKISKKKRSIDFLILSEVI